VHTALLLVHLPWPEPAWFYAFLFALTRPTFGPKGRPKAHAAEREKQLRQELRHYMDANAGQCPPTSSALYTKLRRANLLRLLEEDRLPREEQLRQELRDYMDAHAGQSPPTTSALYAKLRRADMLRLLEEERLPREEQLRQELRDYMVANAGQCPPTTSALYTKLRRAEMLRLLKDMLPRGQGPDTATLDEQLRGGVFKFVADKTVLDCLPYLADLQVTAFQRYSQDAAADRRCCFADIVIAVSRGFEAAAFFPCSLYLLMTKPLL